MSNLKGSRDERIARYKEDRRKQLESQFASLSQPQEVTKKYEPRTTRASRLRAAACAQDTSSLSNLKTEKEKLPQASTSSAPRASTNGLEQDKSNKRRSHLSRSSNSEEVLPNDKTSERRFSRRIFKTEVVTQNSKKLSSAINCNGQNEKSFSSPKASSASANSSSRIVSKKSDSAVPVESKQKNYCSTGGKFEKKTHKTEEEKLKSVGLPKGTGSTTDRNFKVISNKDNVNGTKRTAVYENNEGRGSSSASKKIEELGTLAHKSISGVERLTHKSNNFSKLERESTSKNDNTATTKAVPTNNSDNLFGNVEVRHIKADIGVYSNCDIRRTHSILKKKSVDESFGSQSSVVFHSNTSTSGPVSILKRKISQDDFSTQGGSTCANTPPVTFSPSVVDPSTSRKRQGILKKRRSLDESQVLRNRSCSPEVSQNSRSILKKQRRSSLEDIVRTQSPESGLHGILKRRLSKAEEDLDFINNSPEPQSILKRRSGTSSAGSNTNSPHVSIATAVILAAAGGAEMILDDSDSVKPILKKRSSSEEQPSGDSAGNEVPKPILKKKSSVDWDDSEDKPKRPILKRSSLEDKTFEDTESTYRANSHKYAYQSNGDEASESKNYREMSSRDNSPRPRLSFCMEEEKYKKSSRRTNTASTENNLDNDHKDANVKKARPVSVSDMILNFEKTSNTGAIPKTYKSKRNSERYSTQPVTSQELQVSLDLVENRLQLDQSSLSSPLPRIQTLESIENCSINTLSLSDLTSSCNIENISCFSLLSTTLDSSVSIKMSSDSAFQSLGDGLELEKEEKSSSETSLDSSSLKSGKCLMKALAEEAKNIRMRKGNVLTSPKMKKQIDMQRPSSSRFLTQPVTSEEVKEAANCKDDEKDGKLDRSDPCRLSITERIKMFNPILEEKRSNLPKHRFSRYQTQPVTSEEVRSAVVFPSARVHSSFVLGNSKTSKTKTDSESRFKSKVDDSEVVKSTSNYNTIVKQSENARNKKYVNVSSKTDNSDTTQDEGISSEEQYSGSDIEGDLEDKWNGLNNEKKRAESIKKSVFIRDKILLNKSDVNFTTADNKNSVPTSDEESTMENEVQDTKKRIRAKPTNENLIIKSKSYHTIRDEDKIKNSEVRRSLTTAKMPKSIAELQAKLQKSGDNEWKKRIPKLNSANEELVLLNVKNIYNETLSEKPSILAARKDELDAAAKQWRSRVEQSDAVNFSVAGRMQQKEVPKINIVNTDKSKRTPKAKAFKGKEGGDNGQSESAPASPENCAHTNFKRSVSLPGSGDNTVSSTDVSKSSPISSRTVKVERPDNVTFTNFFKSVEAEKKEDNLFVSIDDFDSIVSHTDNLLVQKRSIKVQKRREASKNPIKALAARTDIIDEYTEVITGVAEREQQRLNVEKLAKSSNFAVEALAGLASKENFSSVALKRSSSLNSTFPPFKDLMLLQIKGRRFVQTRLVEPVASSINEGDNFVLITPNSIYNYIGSYSNVIEQSRASDISNSIQRTCDLGCKTDKIITINAKRIGSCKEEDLKKFWKLLGSNKIEQVAPAGHPDEDEIYESSVLSTNMIYEYKNEELLPVNMYWGAIPKIEMLNALKIFVFDFGSEMYFWTGKNALLDDKKKGLKLARELWNEGYNYTECGINPIGISHALGSRQLHEVNLKDTIRPKWALFAKITQHGETVLFKEKFLDWPDYSRVIRVKTDDNEKNIAAKFDFKPCDTNKLLQKDLVQPDLAVDGLHLGRGIDYFDEETNRLFNFTTKKITCWVILEYSHEEIRNKSIGQFYNGNSYIIRWEYCGIVTGRELSGKPSKHVQAGRDYCVYFCWQGQKATINEKGAAALLTITLDSENARQIRVAQGSEPPAFLNLFKGGMVVHDGKMEKPIETNCKLYICINEIETETFLSQVPCSMRSLRSRSSFLLVNPKKNNIIIWNGSKASNETKNNAQEAASKIVKNRPNEFGFIDELNISVEVISEGNETKLFFNLLGGEKRQLYLSLSKSLQSFNSSPQLFYLTSISGAFESVEILCPYRNEHVTPYPFTQTDLYSVNQPALFMLDDGNCVWLWQGWWPEREDDSNLVDQTGSGRIRWQEERKAAMQTAVNYCKAKYGNKELILAYLVWAGLEPLAFTNLFPSWEERDDIAELNIQDGRKSGETIEVEKELALLTRSTYPLEQLMQRPLPDGVDPVHLEDYLSPVDFEKLTSMPLEEFQKLPIWKQTTIKKEKGLF